MAEWTKNNRACSTLWTTLYNMQQLTTNFDESGDLKITDLTFYNGLGSSDLRRQQATIIADQLDNILREGRGAKYESNIDRTKAIDTMVSILTDESKLVKDLASNVEDSYILWE